MMKCRRHRRGKRAIGVVAASRIDRKEKRIFNHRCERRNQRQSAGVASRHLSAPDPSPAERTQSRWRIEAGLLRHQAGAVRE